MKIICPKDVLLKGVSIVSKAVSTKSSLPIYECFLLHTKEQTIRMTANDTELGIETVLQGLIAEPGSIAIDAKLFSEIVRRLPDNDVIIESEEQGSIIIDCEQAHFQIPGKNPDEFTHMPVVEKNEPVILTQYSLKQIINQTIFSVSDNSSNPIMAGEYMEIQDDKLRLTSLDGHRISIRRLDLGAPAHTVKAIIPGKTLNEIAKILTDSLESRVHLYFTSNHVLFEFDDTTVISRLIEGDYFRIDQMLNQDYETKIIVNKREMMSCIDRSMLLVRESDKKPLIISITDEGMEVMMNSPFGYMNEKLHVTKTGKDIKIGFNPKFISDALRVIDDDEVTLYMVNRKSPCYIRKEDGSYIYLILPVNFVQ